jgi:hypothetical protein
MLEIDFTGYDDLLALKCRFCSEAITENMLKLIFQERGDFCMLSTSNEACL